MEIIICHYFKSEIVQKIFIRKLLLPQNEKIGLSGNRSLLFWRKVWGKNNQILKEESKFWKGLRQEKLPMNLKRLMLLL